MKKMAFVDLTNYDNWPIGGMLSYEKSILPYIVQHYEVDIWGCSVNNVPPKDIIINGTKFIIHTFGNVKTKGKVIPNFWQGLSLIKFKKEFSKYDIVYAHSGSCLYALSLIVDRNKTKLIYHQHGLSYLSNHSLISYSQKPFYYLSQKTSDIVFFVTDKESLEDFCRKKGRYKGFYHIGSPIHTERIKKNTVLKRIEEWSKDKPMTFIYVGRLDNWKNVQLLVKAFALYYRENKDSKFIIIGDGDQLNNIKELVSVLKLEDNVITVGSIPNNEIYKYLENSDTFLIASKGEGMSISVLEAFAAGLPVICSNVPGLEKQVKDKKTGLHADYTEYGFYLKMKEIQNDKYKVMCHNCIEEAQKYDAKIISSFICEKIDQLFI